MRQNQADAADLDNLRIATCEAESDGIPYMPTPEQIREACKQIQAEWSDSERVRRGAYIKPGAKDAIGVGC